jgi:uncharacterized protein (DUF983 family)
MLLLGDLGAFILLLELCLICPVQNMVVLGDLGVFYFTVGFMSDMSSSKYVCTWRFGCFLFYCWIYGYVQFKIWLYLEIWVFFILLLELCLIRPVQNMVVLGDLGTFLFY